MSNPYTGVAGNITAGANPTITEPADGDIIAAASAVTPESTLADFGAYLDRTLSLSAALDVIAVTLGITPSTGVTSVCASGLLTAGGVKWVVVGAAAAISTSDGRLGTWTARTANVGTANLQAVASNGSLIVAVGAGNVGVSAITTSTDGATWTSRTNPGTVQLNSVCWSAAKSLWCAVGTNGLVLTSPDGTTWTSRSAGATTFNAVIWAPGPGLFIAWSGASSSYYTSPDGLTWTLRTGPTTTPNLSCLVAGAGVVVVVNGSSGQIYSSSDGINWTARNLFTASPLACAFNGKVFVSTNVTSATEYYTSFDGITWTEHTLNLVGTATPGAGMQVAAHANGSFLIALGGSTSAVVTAPWQTPP